MHAYRKGRDNLAILGLLHMEEERIRLQQVRAGFDCLTHWIVTALMAVGCLVIGSKRAVEVQCIQRPSFCTRADSKTNLTSMSKTRPLFRLPDPEDRIYTDENR